jgi:hypothetical protein
MFVAIYAMIRNVLDRPRLAVARPHAIASRASAEFPNSGNLPNDSRKAGEALEDKAFSRRRAAVSRTFLCPLAVAHESHETHEDSYKSAALRHSRAILMRKSFLDGVTREAREPREESTPMPPPRAFAAILASRGFFGMIARSAAPQAALAAQAFGL